MNFRLYQIYDKCSGQVVGQIIAHRSDAPAVRTLTDLMQDKNTAVGAHPTDYELKLIGTQNIETGEITPVPPQTIFSGAEYVGRAEKVGSDPLTVR